MVTASLRRTASVCSQAFLSQPANSDHPTSNFTHPMYQPFGTIPHPEPHPCRTSRIRNRKKNPIDDRARGWVAVLGSLGWLGGGARAWARGAGGGGGGGRWRPRHRVSCGPAHAPRQGFETRSPRRAGLLAGKRVWILTGREAVCDVACRMCQRRRTTLAAPVTGAHRTRLPVKPPERSRSGRASQTSMDTERSRPLHYFCHMYVYTSGWVWSVVRSGCTFWLYVLQSP